MTQSRPAKLTKSQFPWCLRCDKRVEALTITPAPRRADTVVVEYRCHGEVVSQEMPASQLAGGTGLASYTAFNDYTSGLMLGEPRPKSAKKGRRR